MGCGCNKTGAAGTIQLFGGKSRRRKKTKRKRRRTRSIIRGGNLGDQMKSLMTISSANTAFGKGNTYYV